MPPVVEAWSLNHWTTREFPLAYFLYSESALVLLTCQQLEGRKNVVLTFALTISQFLANGRQLKLSRRDIKDS